MPLITFTNPGYKDKTVYAVAGSFTETVLKIAKTNRIPIKFDCGDGECASCVIRVKYIGDNGIKVITRIMGLILAVIGTQMVIAGIGGAVSQATGA